MIYPHAKEYLLDVLKKKAENAVELRITLIDFIKETTAYLRLTENAIKGLSDGTNSNYDAFALFLGYACVNFGRLEAIKRIKDGLT